jgi:protein involved in polysaccharide export with SLBB domain
MKKHKRTAASNLKLKPVILALILALFLGTLGAAVAGAQNAQIQADHSPNRNRPIDSAESRAEQAAEELVSLSPDRIIGLLRTEPGLLLQVKKALVRKAYEQGRLLDPRDLTDDSLFRLVREDENVRVLITHEIEDRFYIRAKPTREELERGLVTRPNREQPKEAAAADQNKRNENEEDLFWSAHDGAEERYQFPYGVPQSAQSPQSTPAGPYAQPPAYPPTQPDQQNLPPAAPQNPTPSNSRPQLEMTGGQPVGDYPDSLPPDAAQMPRMDPGEVPQLLAASNTQRQSQEGEGQDYGRGSGYVPGSGSAPAYGLSSPTSANSAYDLQPGSQEQYPQQARLTTATPWQIPPSRPFQRRPAQPALHHQPNPYADVPSLYDLYSQYSGRPAVLERFGADIFRNGTGNFERLPMDMPVGPEYVLGPGDGLSIELWGAVSERLVRVVDRQGRVALPEVGSVEVSGKSLGDVQHIVQTELRTQYRDVQADVSLSRLRSVRVYVVGDVERQGAYDVSALSTPLNAVYMAGGPTSGGSLRVIRHYRGKQLLQEVDVYDLLLHGTHSDLMGLEAGDTILVPPLGAEVTLEGMVRRPAVYELHGEKTLAEVLELGGGVLQSGTLRHVDVERVEAHLSRTMLRLDIPEDNNQQTVTQALEDFQIQDGDKIKISPILPYADKTVYLEGHVFRPGKFAYREGMKVSDVIHSYKDLLPEPYKKHAEVIRLNPPDYAPQVLAFNLDDVLSGKGEDVALKPFDTIRVFGRFDFEDSPVITVTGEVRDPGDHVTNGATYLRDAVYLAGGASPDAQLSDAQIFRKTDDGKLKVLSVNLAQALAGDPKDNILLEPKDRLFIHKDLDRSDPPEVTIEGEVARPGKYPLGDDMSAADLVRLAGGLKRSAFTEEADLTQYMVAEDSKVVGDHRMVPLAKALAGEPDSDVRLHDGDVLTVRQLTGWNDMGASIEVKGEVVHPGVYGIQDGERLSSILARAGGLRSSAYPYGAVFERRQVRELEEKDRGQLMQEIRDQGAELRLAPDTDPDQKLAKEAALEQWQETLEKLQNLPPEGRLVIHISSNTKRWANTSNDIQVRAGDSILIPKKPNTVTVDGSVYNPTAITFKPGRNAGWYLRQAGGPTNMANRRAMFVIRADGSVVGHGGGLLTGGADKADLVAGDMVVVPQKAFSANTRWKSILEGSQVAYAVGIAIQVARSF